MAKTRLMTQTTIALDDKTSEVIKVSIVFYSDGTISWELGKDISSHNPINRVI